MPHLVLGFGLIFQELLLIECSILDNLNRRIRGTSVNLLRQPFQYSLVLNYYFVFNLWDLFPLI